MAMLPQKTPICLLQELCARNGLTPDYKLLSVEGAVHAPTFMYRVQVGDVVATATGQSKKKAKHAAAKAILEKLLTGDGPFNDPSTFADGSAVDGSVLEVIKMEQPELTSNDDGIPGNPVGTLQELCMKRRLRPPFYETVFEEGLPHERQFGIACYVCERQQIGFGKSKRLAKRQAAHKMLEILEEIKGDDSEFENDQGKFEMPFLDGRDYLSHKDQKIPVLTSSHSHQISQFFKNLQESKGECLESLSQLCLNDTTKMYVDILNDLADEQNFEITYVAVKDLNRKGKHQCLVQLSSLPVAVCFGTGDTSEEAKNDAAHNALQYLKIILQK